MKMLLVLGLVAVMTSGALAHADDENIDFSNAGFVDETTNLPNTFAPFNAYFVVLRGPANSIAGDRGVITQKILLVGGSIIDISAHHL